VPAFNHGLALKRLGDWDRALPNLERALRIYLDAQSLNNAADCRMALGNLFVDVGGYATAFAHYEGVRRLLPPDAAQQAHAMLGIAIARIGLRRSQGIEQELTRLFRDELCDVRWQAGHVLAVFLRQHGRIEEALTVIAEVLTLSPAAPGLVAATTAEQLVCQLLLGAQSAARTTLAQLAPLLSSADVSDSFVWVCAATWLGWEAPWPRPSSAAPYDYERRWHALTMAITAQTAHASAPR
jgi:tetratricopeptide (TPR) repeat protein